MVLKNSTEHTETLFIALLDHAHICAFLLLGLRHCLSSTGGLITAANQHGFVYIVTLVFLFRTGRVADEDCVIGENHIRYDFFIQCFLIYIINRLYRFFTVM